MGRTANIPLEKSLPPELSGMHIMQTNLPFIPHCMNFHASLCYFWYKVFTLLSLKYRCEEAEQATQSSGKLFLGQDMIVSLKGMIVGNIPRDGQDLFFRCF